MQGIQQFTRRGKSRGFISEWMSVGTRGKRPRMEGHERRCFSFADAAFLSVCIRVYPWLNK